MVEIAVGEDDGGDGRVPRPARMQALEALDLLARTSGEAFRSTQSSPSALTATLSWLRGVARTLPSRTPRQLGQPQFHWGKPPPAAEPSTRMRTIGPPKTRQPPGSLRAERGLKGLAAALAA